MKSFFAWRSGISGRMVIALVIAGCGTVLAWRSLDRSVQRDAIRATTPDTKEIVRAREAFGRFTFDESEDFNRTGLAEHVHDFVLNRASKLSREQDNISLSAEQAMDLADAVKVRIEATIFDPSFEDHVDYLHNRGDSRSPSENERASWHSFYEFQKSVPVRVEELRMRVLYSDGERIARPAVDQGLSSLTSRPEDGRFPLPEDPVGGKLDVIEITMPAQIRDIRTRTLRTAVLGFSFAWSVERGQWIPWEVAIYRPPDAEAVLPALPF